jgi:hypothetical protein
MTSLNTILNTPELSGRDWNRRQTGPMIDHHRSGWSSQSFVGCLEQPGYSEACGSSWMSSGCAHPVLNSFFTKTFDDTSHALLGAPTNSLGAGTAVMTWPYHEESFQMALLQEPFPSASPCPERSLAPCQEHRPANKGETVSSQVRLDYWIKLGHLTDSGQISGSTAKPSPSRSTSSTRSAPPSRQDGTEPSLVQRTNPRPSRSSGRPRYCPRVIQRTATKRSACHSCKIKKIRCSVDTSQVSPSVDAACG